MPRLVVKEHVGLRIDRPESRRRSGRGLGRRRCSHQFGQIENIGTRSVVCHDSDRSRAAAGADSNIGSRSGTRGGGAAGRAGGGVACAVAALPVAAQEPALAPSRRTGLRLGGVIVGDDATNGGENFLHRWFLRFRRLRHPRILASTHPESATASRPGRAQPNRIIQAKSRNPYSKYGISKVERKHRLHKHRLAQPRTTPDTAKG